MYLIFRGPNAADQAESMQAWLLARLKEAAPDTNADRWSEVLLHPTDPTLAAISVNERVQRFLSPLQELTTRDEFLALGFFPAVPV